MMNTTILVTGGAAPGVTPPTWSLPASGFSNPMYITSPTLGVSDSTGFDLAGATSLTIAFEGTYGTQTVVHEQTMDPSGQTGWFSVFGISATDASTSNSGSTTATAYNFGAYGLRHRIRVTALGSGTMAVRIMITQ